MKVLSVKEKNKGRRGIIARGGGEREFAILEIMAREGLILKVNVTSE